MVERTEHRRPDRLTITLGPGQREALQAIADRNNAAMAFVVRYALDQFIHEQGTRQLRLEFPDRS